MLSIQSVRGLFSYYIISISASLYNGAKLSSAESQCLNIGTDDVSFHVFISFFFSFEFVPGTKRNVSGACLSQKRKKSREIKVFTMSYSGLTDITTVRTKMWNRWRNWGTRRSWRPALGMHLVRRFCWVDCPICVSKAMLLGGCQLRHRERLITQTQARAEDREGSQVKAKPRDGNVGPIFHWREIRKFSRK